MPTLSAESLSRFAYHLLTAATVPGEKADLVARSLVAANLRAVDSHGLQLLPYYLEQIQMANINVHTDGHVAKECGGCLTYDGESGIGQWISQICCKHAIRLARAHGLAAVVARESNHFGAAAFWAQQISAAGCIGIVMCNATPLVAPWQGKEPRFGTNPICMSVPGPNSWLLDMATTTVALGKILNAQNHGRDTIPAGWAMDSEGVPTTDTQTALTGLLMPLGGYKGSGLAMMAEILCAALGGGAMSTQLGGLRVKGQPMRTSQFFMALEVSRFMPLADFEKRMQELVEIVKSSTPAQGYDEVLVAGDPEWRAETQRRKDGIPLSEGAWQGLLQAAQQLHVEAPEPASA
ncbi:MAG TPA: Ldh family oxidoreductase [Bryobacteraceae bacterium]|nr:Ldh family oxidoreductase [Bryobacteraceae bacterium]